MLKYILFNLLLILSPNGFSDWFGQLSLRGFVAHTAKINPKKFITSKFAVLSKDKQFVTISGPNEFQYSIPVDNWLQMHSNNYSIPVKLLKAILLTESDMDNSAIRCKPRCTDFGIGQINIFHLRNGHIKADRILSDLNYSVRTTLKILKSFKPVKNVDKLWYLRYNVGTGRRSLNTKAARDYCLKLEKNGYKGCRRILDDYNK